MKVISYNIQFGKGMDGVIDLIRSCGAIRGADIICLQEVEQEWTRSGERDQAADIAASRGLRMPLPCIMNWSYFCRARFRCLPNWISNQSVSSHGGASIIPITAG
jgi:endonuclease/exonuclease/phosphatase family metal-dependent hydrolase